MATTPPDAADPNGASRSVSMPPSTPMEPQTTRPPPRLNFDDGSRIMAQAVSPAAAKCPTESAGAAAAGAVSAAVAVTSPRGDVPLSEYYEIEYVSSEVVSRLLVLHRSDDANDAAATDAAADAAVAGSSTMITRRAKDENDGFLCRVALQFPDDLLPDSAEVSWLVEDAIVAAYQRAVSSADGNESTSNSTSPPPPPPPPLVFVLGDTTYGSCCPDEIGAAHLDADVLIHYGHACLGAPTQSLPVVYSFGPSELDATKCADVVLGEMEAEAEAEAEEGKGGGEGEGDDQRRKFLVLFEVRHHRKVEDVVRMLKERGVEAIRGRIPDCDGAGAGRGDTDAGRTDTLPSSGGGCCGRGSGDQVIADVSAATGDASNVCCGRVAPATTASGALSSSQCCKEEAHADEDASPSQAPLVHDTAHEKESAPKVDTEEDRHRAKAAVIGGLEISSDIDLSQYTLLYIGDDECDSTTGGGTNRQFLNTLLRCSSPGGTKSCWSYNPTTTRINTDPTTTAKSSKYLNRRFYLTQKARLSSIIGILVGTLSQSRFRSVIEQTRRMIEESGRSCYTFAVGKINVAKLANYAEVDCFVLVACTETSILDDEREFHVPVVTPLELEVALDRRPWDGFYSHEFGDVLLTGGGKDGGDGGPVKDGCDGQKGSGDDDDDDSDDDEPFFSVISGKYESKKSTRRGDRHGESDDDDAVNLKALPGGGQVTEYRSGAAEFWKEREYQGLEANVGKNEVKAAVRGQVGIASDYGEER